MRDIALVFFVGRLQQFVRLAQRARHGGDDASAVAQFGLCGDQLVDVVDGIQLAADGLAQAFDNARLFGTAPAVFFVPPLVDFLGIALPQ